MISTSWSYLDPVQCRSLPGQGDFSRVHSDSELKLATKMAGIKEDVRHRQNHLVLPVEAPKPEAHVEGEGEGSEKVLAEKTWRRMTCYWACSMEWLQSC
ncbi:hypothetical protein ACS0TY_033589 [Phlomoides rotata]